MRAPPVKRFLATVWMRRTSLRIRNINGGRKMKQITAGALEVYFASVQMKKNRPGTLLTVLAKPEQRQELSAIIFRETTTIGVRYHEVTRERLDREMVAVDTPFGPVRFKVASLGGEVVNASPEFEDCLRLASARGVPLKDIQQAAGKAFLDAKSPEQRAKS